MKRSHKISLLVLGTAALLSGCSSNSTESDIRQEQYASKADCERDWGDLDDDEEICASTHGGAYLGPRYYWNHSTGKPVAVMRNGTHRAMSSTAMSRSPLVSTYKSSSASSHHASISRGGFGSSGRSSGGG